MLWFDYLNDAALSIKYSDTYYSWRSYTMDVTMQELFSMYGMFNIIVIDLFYRAPKVSSLIYESAGLHHLADRNSETISLIYRELMIFCTEVENVVVG